MAKARRRNHLQVLGRMTELVDDQHHIVESKPLIVRETHTAQGHPVALEGNDDEDPLFLQFKEAQRSVLASCVSSPPWDCEGRRVVVGQRLIQGAPDIVMGWGIAMDGTHFYMRQLRDMKGNWELDLATTRMKGLPDYGRLCGWALALAHARSGDAAMIGGYLGGSQGMDDTVVRFAVAYAEQTDRDHDALVKAARTKRIPVAKAT